MASRPVDKSLITSAPPLPSTWTAQAQLQERDGLKNCDGVGTFQCDIGTCYTGIDGYIGCCSASSCARRTTCLSYDPSSTSTCDMNTGGCVVCSRSDAPACVTITNVLEHQYIMYCAATATTGTLSYHNLVGGDSTAREPASAAASSTAGSGFFTSDPEPSVDPSIPSTLTVFTTHDSLPTTPSISTTLTPSLASSSLSSSSSSTPSPTPPPPSHTLSPPATIALATSLSLAVLLTLLTLLYLFLLRPILARRSQRHAITAFPRGTLGGAALPDGTPLMESSSPHGPPQTRSTEKEQTTMQNASPQSHEWKAAGNHDSLTTVGSPELGSKASGPAMTQPWDPNGFVVPRGGGVVGMGIGTASPELDGLQHVPRSPELDGRAVTPEWGQWGAAPAVRPSNPPAGEGWGGGPAQAHATAATASMIPDALFAGPKQPAGLGIMDPASGAPEVAGPGTGGKPLPQTPEVGTAPSMGAGGNGFLSPVMPSTGRESGMSTGMVSSLSESGRGSWLSPEMAMAGGWRNEEEGVGGRDRNG